MLTSIYLWKIDDAYKQDNSKALRSLVKGKVPLTADKPALHLCILLTQVNYIYYMFITAFVPAFCIIVILYLYNSEFCSTAYIVGL